MKGGGGGKAYLPESGNDRANLKGTIAVSLCRGNDKDGEKEGERWESREGEGVEYSDRSWRLSSRSR